MVFALHRRLLASFLLVATVGVNAQTAPSESSSEAVPATAGVEAEKQQASAVDSVVTQQSTVPVSDVKGRFEARFPGIEIVAVRTTPFSGVYEVQVGMDLLYSDADVSYVMQGSLIDAQSRIDLTSKRLAELTQVPFDQLPFDKAIKQVKGNGERVLVAFEDPNCGYCKRLHETLNEVDNVTVYTLLYPILSPDSQEKSRNIWCAPDRVAAWRNWMLDGVVPPKAECETPVEDIAALGRQMTIRGTPALFFADGSRVNGAMPLKALVEKLDAVAKAQAGQN